MVAMGAVRTPVTLSPAELVEAAAAVEGRVALLEQLHEQSVGEVREVVAGRLMAAKAAGVSLDRALFTDELIGARPVAMRALAPISETEQRSLAGDR